MPEIQKIGNLSPGDLLTCITMAYEEKLASLNQKYSEPARIEKEAPEKQGVYMKINKDEFLDMLMASEAVFKLAFISKPNLYVTTLRRLLADNDPEYERLANLPFLTIEDIAKQYRRLVNSRNRQER